MSLSDHGLNVVKKLFSNKEEKKTLDSKLEQPERPSPEAENKIDILEVKADVIKSPWKLERRKQNNIITTKSKINLKGKILKNADLIDKRYEKNMCSKDAQRKAKDYFGVKIPWWDGSALKTRNSYDKTIDGKKADFLSYKTLDVKDYKNMSVDNYTKEMEYYFHSLSGNFFDIMMESPSSPRHWHRAIWFRGTDNEIYIIDNAAKNEKMRSGAVPLSYYIKNFVVRWYWINGVWNYDTKYAYNVDPNNYNNDYSSVA